MKPGHVYLCLFFLLFEPSMTILVSSPFTQSSGRVDQCNAIFQFSNSLGIATRIESSYYCNANFYNWTSYPRTASWMRGTDCCKWDGITCDNVTGDVIEVNLSCSRLQGILHVNSTLFSLRNLRALYLRDNKLDGPIPPCLGNLTKISSLSLSFNHIRGSLPRSLANCTSNLGELDFSNNELEDLFPSWLEALPSLYVLGLRSNKFHGLVKSSRSAQPFPRLHIFDISNNNFSGAFPTQYIASFKGMMGGDKVRGNLLFQEHGVRNFYTTHVIGKGNILDLRRIHKTYTVIDLSCNHFQGEIPELIGDLKLLIGLNFSHNNLTGAIPYSLGNLTNLEWLDLSFNNLTGKIPGSLADLTSLEYLNLSTNRLVGPIPEGKQLNTFQSDAFGGNPGLCGFPLQRQCGGDANEPPASSTLKDEENTNNGSWIEWQAVPLGYGCGTVLGLSVGYIILHFQRPLWLMRMIERRIYKLQRRARRTHER
ncbi:hypothetical protein CRG98_043115 [Punica granatum]|uniref:Leucine-rich repeat-containing N-terminal plant-type domain-containing protein n=1 Tax=Punica granatum TaxID=22663 RepID=A0A2I0HXR4_PUNGR|nr:hypothetical protein CRG98_043115 [Punica granatum]